MEELFEELARKKDFFREMYTRIVLKDWENVVGEKMARHVLPKKVELGVLYLSYDDPLFANEVRMRGEEIIRILNERLKGISKIDRIKFVRRGG